MTKPVVSILISSHDRLPLFRRTLWSIVHRPPTVPFEVVVCDDGSAEDILGELKKHSSAFPWKFVPFDAAAFEAATGLTKFHNNPAVTNNIAFRHSQGEFIFQQGNEVIAWKGELRDGPGVGREVSAYDKLLGDAPQVDYWMVMSTTYDVPAAQLHRLDEQGTNLTAQLVEECKQWPLQSEWYRSDVTNYISLAPRRLWEALSGYDERYYAGIAAEDSDFVRRARRLPGFVQVISTGVSLHQYHRGKTKYYCPPPSVISAARWQEGCAINRVFYDNWDGTFANPQKWPWGTLGAGKVVSNT
jgi:hypothetical protein